MAKSVGYKVGSRGRFIFHTCVVANRRHYKRQAARPRDEDANPAAPSDPARRQESGGFCGERKNKKLEAGAGPSEP